MKESNNILKEQIGEVNLKCINKFINNYEILLEDLEFKDIAMNDYKYYSLYKSDKFDSIKKERLKAINNYTDEYLKSLKNCREINKILTDNGTLDKLKENYEDYSLFGIVFNNERVLINDYFKDFSNFVKEKEEYFKNNDTYDGYKHSIKNDLLLRKENIKQQYEILKNTDSTNLYENNKVGYIINGSYNIILASVDNQLSKNYLDTYKKCASILIDSDNNLNTDLSKLISNTVASVENRIIDVDTKVYKL